MGGDVGDVDYYSPGRCDNVCSILPFLMIFFPLLLPLMCINFNQFLEMKAWCNEHSRGDEFNQYRIIGPFFEPILSDKSGNDVLENLSAEKKKAK